MYEVEHVNKAIPIYMLVSDLTHSAGAMRAGGRCMHMLGEEART